jgi:hypothetical protein
MGGGSSWYIFLEYGSSGTNNGFTPSGLLGDNPAPFITHYRFPQYIAVTVSSDGLTWRHYKNGQFVGQNVLGTPAQKSTGSNSQRWYIGGHPGSNNFIGDIMAVNLTASTLSDNDIETRYMDDLSEPISFAKFFDIEAAYEDRLELPTAGGPDSYAETIQRGTGQSVPGAVTRSTTRSADGKSMKDQAAYEDDLTFPYMGGPPAWEGADTSTAGVLPPDINQEARTPRYPHFESSYEDRLSEARLSGDPQFSNDTDDDEGHPHFTASTHHYFAPWMGHYYYTDEEPWANPTAHNFTGFARNGKRYTNGVEDAGPTWAPWATEGASNDRSARVEFPSKALVVGTWREVVIFDCDNYDPLDHATLKVWMRFKYGTSANTMIMRGNACLRDVKMVNGWLLVATLDSDGGEGQVIILDFKGEGQDVGHRIGANNHYKLLSGYTMQDRNVEGLWTATGVSPSLRTYSENIYRIDGFIGDVDTNQLYVAYAGEDPGDGVFFVESGVPQHHVIMHGDLRITANEYNYWNTDVCFDRQGWLWTTAYNRVFRHLDYYKDQVLRQESTHRLQLYAELPHNVYDIVAARDDIYALTSVGIYKINRTTLEFHLAYTVDGLGGQGRIDGYGLGEILHGEVRRGFKLAALNLETSSYIGVIMSMDGSGDGWGKCGATVVRLFDDQVMYGRTYPELVVDGGFCIFMVPY